MRSAEVLERILSIEVGAARIEGALMADPDLGRVWRAQVALTEACRSVGMEDISVQEGDLATRPLRVDPDEGETARGVWLAGETLRILLSPGNLITDPERAVRRCLQTGVRPDGSEGQMPEAEPELVSAISDAVRDAPGPLIGALRAALTMRTMTMSASPSAERLLFTCADHAIRGGRAGREITDPLPEGLGLTAGPGEPRWILMPASGLSTGGFRVWSPGTSSGLASFLDGMRDEVGRGLGALPPLRRWRDLALASGAGRHGRSRMRDLVRLLMSRPIITGQIVADELGITPRGALNLIGEAEAAGLLQELTRRRSYRAWAVSPMAARIRHRSVARGMRGRPGRSAEGTAVPADDFTEEGVSNSQAPVARDRSGEEAALAELDAALAAADRILEKYRPR
jgi:hypothetical protein